MLFEKINIIIIIIIYCGFRICPNGPRLSSVLPLGVIQFILLLVGVRLKHGESDDPNSSEEDDDFHYGEDLRINKHK